MKAAIVLVALMVVYAIAESDFGKFKEKYDKNYKDKAAEEKAKAAYQANKDRIEQHNKNAQATYTQGVNDNSDRAPKDDEKPAGADFNMKQAKKVKYKVKGLPQDLPATINHGSKLPAVIDQKTCRSDYVHSVISIYSFYSQKKTLFSSQDVIDCDKENYGCKGGNPVSAMLYFQAKGLSNGTTYKYVAKNMTCQKEKFPSIANAEKLGPCGVMIDGKQYDSDFMKAVVAQMGPITVFMNANMKSKAFYSYKAGIFTDTTCSKNISMSDTFVTIVGYGTDTKAGKFWIVRNSFGASWGEKGYFRIKRGENMCGIENVLLLPCATE